MNIDTRYNDLRERRLLYTKGMRAAALLIQTEILNDQDIDLTDAQRQRLEDRIEAYETIIKDIEDGNRS